MEEEIGGFLVDLNEADRNQKFKRAGTLNSNSHVDPDT